MLYMIGGGLFMKYIMDTDPGIDDAIAIMLAYQNNLDIVGFTLTSGNIETEKAENNLKIIQDFLESNIKMYKSAVENKCDHETAYYAHGKDGLGYAVFPKSKRKIEKMSAEDFMIKSSKRFYDNLTIICLGPLTNIARAIKKDKNFAKRVKHLIIMGTTFAPNAEKPYLEFNVNVDLEAAKLVFNSGFEDIKVVTHEIGIESFVEKEYVSNLKNSDNLISRFVGLISDKYMEFSYEHYKTVGLGTPDPTTVASIIDPDIVKFEPCNIDIITEGEHKGECIVNLVESSNIQVSTSFDLDKFRTLFKNTFN